MSAEYTCNLGFANSSDVMRKSCQANGSFMENAVACERISCPALVAIQHGYPSAASGSYQDIVRFHCDPG